MGLRFGIDLGGTKTEIVALAADGHEALRRRRPTPAKDYDAIVENIAGLVEEAERELGARGTVGIGIPGAPSHATGLIKNANTTVLIGRAFQKDLERRLDRPVRLANDANCLALSEASDGAAAGAGVVFAAILGTGVGGGISVNGHILPGQNSIAGEWGHSPLPWLKDDERPGATCYCGKQGCIETFLCGPQVTTQFKAMSGRTMTATEIASAATAGDDACEKMLQQYEERLARAFSGVINLLDPDVIVLGGGVSKLDRLCVNVPKLWGQYAFSDQITTKLVRAKHGDSSGVRGAAWLWSLTESA